MERRSYSRANSMASVALAMLTLPSSAFAASEPIYRYAASSTEPSIQNSAIPASAATQGLWWPLVGLHVTVMPDGRVLTFGTPVGISVQDGRTLDIWNPALGFSPSSHLQIANGRQFLRFNRDPADNGKRRVAADLTTATPGSAAPWSILRLRLRLIYNNGKPLHEQRWYSTMITLQDGRTLIGGECPTLSPTPIKIPGGGCPTFR
jgi:galactose oxidase